MTEARARSGKFRRGRRAALAAACVLALVAWWRPGVPAEVFRQARGLVLRSSAGVAALAQYPAQFVRTHRHFRLREIKVSGANRARAEDLVLMSGLDPHHGIWNADPVEIEKRVERHPWVRRALVQRDLPARLIITVDEWKAAAIVALDRLYYVDADGVIFKALDDEDSVDFPFVTGLRAAGLAPEGPATRGKLSQVLELARAVERVPLKLSEVRFRPDGDIVLYPVSCAVRFRMGWGGWDDKLGRLRWFLREFREQEALFEAVDLSFKGQVVTRPRKRA